MSEAFEQFIVSHGRSGAVGVFTSETPLTLPRGARVVVQTARGTEIGAVLGPASIRQARLLGAAPAGTLLRAVTSDEEAHSVQRRQTESALFDAAREFAARDGLMLEVLDTELLFDGQIAIVQFVGEEKDVDRFAQALEQRFQLTIRLENLAVPTPHEEEHHHCDKPDCGREAGGCSDCSSGGGCSSCGSSKVDLREYFGHLRQKMEVSNRVPLT